MKNRIIVFSAAADPDIYMSAEECSQGSGRVLIRCIKNNLWTYPHPGRSSELISLGLAILRDEIIYDGDMLPTPTEVRELAQGVNN